MKKNIPEPTIERLSSLYTLLDRLEKDGTEMLSSKKIGGYLGISPYTVRKDIGYLTGAGKETGYQVGELKKSLYDLFGLGRIRNACVAGMGRLGCAITNFSQYVSGNIRIVAGFDSNINVIETIDTKIPMYPACEIPDTVKSLGIEIGIITVPPDQAQLTAERMIRGGVKGIVNFTPVIIKTFESGVTVKNFNINDEFRILSIMMDMKENN